jgi:phasin family protein
MTTDRSAKTTPNSFFDGWLKLVTPFSPNSKHFSQMCTFHWRSLEATTQVTQLATESLNAVLHRQIEIVNSLARDSADSVRQLTSTEAPEERIVLQADLVKAGFDKGLTNLRQMSDILVKANAEAGDVLAKRVGESLAELKTAFAAA